MKRTHPEDEPNGTPKRIRSVNGSPAPPSNGDGPSVKEKMMADARARAAAVAARLQQARGGASAGASAGRSGDATPPASTTASTTASVSDKVAEMRARVAAARAKATASVQTRTISPVAPPSQPPPPAFDESRGRGGLDVGLHPALMGDAGHDARSGRSRQAIHPKFATTMANRRPESPITGKPGKGHKQLDLSGPSLEEIRSNPYYDPSLGPQTATSRGRSSRQLIFNQKGKYIAQAAALRRQAALEAMKKRIADSTRRAGMAEDLDTEKAFLVSAPPEIEWWDEGLVNGGKDYTDITSLSGLKIDTEDSIITIYIQHPVALEPPQDKNMPTPKPMYLTPKETAKLRRQRRMADLKEQQAKIRLGLEPAPPPKVKKSNLMRVLGEEAVKDPTAVEARVNREIQARYDEHMTTNEDRKLTKEQQHEKLAEQQVKDAALGIHATVYKIDSLANGRHRFKIWKNAEQSALTGICILHPKFCLVVVEGGQHSIKFFKKLMTNRIDWTENSGPNSVREGNQEATAAFLQSADDSGNLKDLSLNSCSIVWEGEMKNRAFRKWGSRVCETDKEAKDALTRAKMDSMWTLAKSMTGNTT